jgi:ubiquinone/menaquinone biosynthesis C-methylase UbiE
MTPTQEYVLGQSDAAARRLEIQDAHFAEGSEKLLDELRLRPADRVVELGCGAGSFSRRVLRRLGADGVLVGVDASQGLLDQARRLLAECGPARFEPVLGNIDRPAAWLDGVDVVVARTVLHHVPMVENLVGRLLALLRHDARVGFIEPDFRTPLARLAYVEAKGRAELAPLRTWVMAINQLYGAKLLSPAVGATLARAMQLAGYRDVQSSWTECRSDGTMIENMLMFYDEVRGQLQALGLLSSAEVDEQQRLLRALPPDRLPPAWGSFSVSAVT